MKYFNMPIRSTTPQLYIDTNRRITDRFGTVVEPDKDDSNFVHIFFRGKRQKLNVTWLWLYCWFDIPGEIAIGDVIFIPLHDTNHRSVQFSVLFRRPYVVHKRYRIVPIAPMLAVSDNGEVIVTSTGEPRTQRVDDEGYSSVSTTTSYGRSLHVRVHRAVANAWIGKNQDSDHPVINHKNSRRSDNRVSNLEWCTPRDNVIHAYDSDTGSKYASPIEIRNIYTDEITVYRRLSLAANALGVLPSVIQRYGNHLGLLFDDKYELRFVDDRRDWFYTSIPKRYGDWTGNSRYIVKESDKVIKIFGTENDVFTHYKLKRVGVVGTAFRDWLLEVLPGSYSVVMQSRGRGTPLIVTQPDGSEIQVKGIRDAKRHTHLDRNTIRRLLNKSLPEWKGYKIRFLDPKATCQPYQQHWFKHQ